MKRDPRVDLENVNLAAGQLAEHFGEPCLEDFMTDIVMQGVAERQLTVIDAALTRLKKHSPAVAARLPDLPITADLRNCLMHGYNVIDPEIVWKIALEDVPRQRRVVQSVLAELDREAAATPEPHLADDVPAPS